MKYLIYFLVAVLLPTTLFAQMTGKELLDKTMAFHDPDQMWENARMNFKLEQSRPNGNSRSSDVTIHNDKQYFKLIESRSDLEIVREVSNNSGKVWVNGEENFSQEISDQYRLSPDRILRTRNYYVYLYGLPMKLTDPGTNIGEEVRKVEFNGKEYLELAITYDKGVGTDEWYFYIHPETYAMEGYKFYQENGNGEYITLDEISEIGSMKIPKIRTWYTTQDSTLLGTDRITNASLIK